MLSFGRKIDDDLLDELEETLIRDDIGVETTDKLITELREAYQSPQDQPGCEESRPVSQRAHEKLLASSSDRQLRLSPRPGPTVILVAGVNGVGKTTSIAKLAQNFHDRTARKSSWPPAIRSAPPPSNS